MYLNFNKIGRYFPKVIAIFILLNILWLLPITIEIIATTGGQFGFGLLLLPFNFFGLLFVIPVIKTLNKTDFSTMLVFLDLIGFFVFLGLLWFYLIHF